MGKKYLLDGRQVLETRKKPEMPGELLVKLRPQTGDNPVWERMTLEEYKQQLMPLHVKPS